MTELPTYIYTAYAILLAVAITLLLVFSLIAHSRAHRNRRFEERLSQLYMRIATTIILSNENLPTRFPMIERRGAKELLARVLAKIAGSVYGPDSAAVGRIAIDNNLDHWLLRQIERHRGYRRAFYLSLLAVIPLSGDTLRQLSRYKSDSNPLILLYVLIAHIGSDSSSALRELAEYPRPLNAFERGEIMAILRRGMLPVAFEPLLASPNCNLRIVGLDIVREFGISEAEPLLLDIISTDPDPAIAQEALFTLVAMHSSLSSRQIRACVSNMQACERRSLCRRLALEGYSASALAHLFGNYESCYAEQIVTTYKRRIICTPQI